jgi:hypothetical protein
VNWWAHSRVPPGSYPNSADESATLTISQTIKYEDWTDAQNVTHTVSGELGYLTAENNLDWSGTLSLRASLQVAEIFTWQAGTINFNGGAYTLELSGGAGSTWAGGQIGDSESSSTFKIDNSTTLAIQVPSGGGSVTLGVPMVIQDALTNVTVSYTNVNFTVGTITVTVTGGTLEFSGSQVSGYNFGPSSQANGDYVKGASGNITFDTEAGYNVTASLWNVGATVQFQEGSNIDIPNGSTATSSRSFLQEGGTTILGTSGGGASGGDSGATVTCDRGFWQTGGSFQTYSYVTQTLVVGDLAPTQAYFTGGSIKVGADLTGDNYGELDVRGYLEMSGSTMVYVAISLVHQDDRTTISVSGRIQVDDSSGSNLTSVVVTAIGPSNPDATSWLIFVSVTSSFTGQFALVTNGYQLDNPDGDADFVER